LSNAETNTQKGSAPTVGDCDEAHLRPTVINQENSTLEMNEEGPKIKRKEHDREWSRHDRRAADKPGNLFSRETDVQVDYFAFQKDGGLHYRSSSGTVRMCIAREIAM
jgi:hypothetical protein